jgi:hypothetical protein
MAFRFELAALNTVLLFDIARLTTPYETGLGGDVLAASPFGPRFRPAVTGQTFGAFFVECANVQNRGFKGMSYAASLSKSDFLVVFRVLPKMRALRRKKFPQTVLRAGFGYTEWFVRLGPRIRRSQS